MILTRNAADLLGVGANDEITVKTSALDEATVPIAHIADNYLGNAAYLTQSAYEQLFDEEVQPTASTLHFQAATPKKRHSPTAWLNATNSFPFPVLSR